MFLMNAWYVAAWGHELGHELFERTLLGRPVLMFRRADGTAVALGNRCPHRFAPLHRGKLADGVVQCPYHGLRFDSTGACVLNPNGDRKIPAKSTLPSYPLVERHALLWIWLGDPAGADPALIPDFSCLADTVNFRTVGGVIEMKAHYELVTDNLMDLTHVEFVHEGTVGSAAIARGEHEIMQQGTTVYSNLWCPDGPVPPAWIAALKGYDREVDQWLYMRWDAPCNMLLDVGVTPVGRSRAEGAWVYGTDILTPKDAHSTHYFWGISQNYALDDPSQDGHWHHWIDAAFVKQDKPILEAQAEMMGGANFDDLDPILLSSDRGPVRCRRIMRDLIATQRPPQPTPVSIAALRARPRSGVRIDPVV